MSSSSSSPSNKSLTNLSGKWKQSKPLTSDIAPVLEIQGFNALMRKAILAAPVHLSIDQKSESEIVIEQSTSASLPGIREVWFPPTDGKFSEWIESEDKLMGKVRSRSGWFSVGELKKDEETEGFLVEGLQAEEKVIWAEVESLAAKKAWKAVQVWRMEGGRFVRRVVTTGTGGEGGKAETVLVYEFEG
ncbi:hypothetical protein KC332_g16589 [Hortaea werneckii]|uniref:Lipocalin-like domain-containing protein n=2 Tax=Hortaea werneckii TaxID=91943 RepID=A0A3M7I694_HORWE|nr:hypothetical protein KC350_g16307 [Hortaea werneckii]OTA20277.1 hypothetical protein BTJ68_15350 [Hortaea werneckii EXF-2000]KAI6807276.1 hypothetical protein KC358_g13461 [Hortaea werneckii]KAI6900840.1 hypothetical protein KC348_g16686 [Hortaea werneckii]KAI6920892.1 hypothetical protein KC341_g16299 [Hortaea werneckii]